jgi:hypothetical protein
MTRIWIIALASIFSFTAAAQEYADPLFGNLGDHEYGIIFSNETFMQAFFATEPGGRYEDWNLASIGSDEENAFITSGLLFNGAYWLGGGSVDCGNFAWLAPPVPFTGYENWAPNQPLYCAQGLDFITITANFQQPDDGQWVNLPDNVNSSGFILKRLPEPAQWMMTLTAALVLAGLVRTKA